MKTKNKEKLKNWGAIICVLLAVCLLAVHFIIPEQSQKVLDDLKAGTITLGYKVFSGGTKECSSFIETADGKYLCEDTVYDCNDKPSLVEGVEVCNGVKYEGSPDLDSFFGDVHVPDGAYYSRLYHHIKPKQIYDAEAEVYYTTIDYKNKITNIVVERKVHKQSPIYGTKQVCVWNDFNSTEDCWNVEDKTNVTGYDWIEVWENNNTDRSVLKLNAYEQPDIRGTFVLEESTLKNKPHIDVIPHIRFTHPTTKEVKTYSQIEWDDIYSNSDNLIYWEDCEDNDWVTSSTGAGSVNNLTSSGVTNFLDGGKVGQLCHFDANADVQNDYIPFFQNGSYTICLFINGSNPYSDVSAGTDSTGGNYFHMMDDSTLAVTHDHDGAGSDYLAGTTSIDYSVVMSSAPYVCATYDNNSKDLALYLNGACDKSENGTFSRLGNIANNPYAYFHSQYGVNGKVVTDFDNLVFFNVSLPPDDIATLYGNDGVPETLNNAPDNPTLKLNFTNEDGADGVGNYTNESLWCEVYVDDSDDETDLSVDIIVMNSTTDDIDTAVEQYKIINAFTSVTYETYIQLNLTAENHTKGDHVWCQARVYDQSLYSSWVNSSNLRVFNHPPYNSTLANPNSQNEDFSPNGAYAEILSQATIDNTWFDEDQEDNSPTTYEIIDESNTAVVDTQFSGGNFQATSIANQTGSSQVLFSLNDSNGNGTLYYVTVTLDAVNDAPWWDAIANATYTSNEDEDEPLSTLLNASAYFRDVASEGTDKTPSNITISTNETKVNCYMNTDSNFTVFCEGTQNYAGDFIIILNGTDGSSPHLGSETISFEASLTNSNDDPWWDDVTNNSITLYYDTLDQNVSVGFADYFQDPEDDSPVLAVLSDNSSDFSCEIQSGDLICDTSTVGGSVIINVQGNDSDDSPAYMSFEVSVNTPPTAPTNLIPEDLALNDTWTLNLSCSGSTDADGDAVFYDFYNVTSTGDLTNNICLNVGEECLLNATDTNGWVYWRCYANDTTDNSSISSIRSIRSETWEIIDLNQSASATVIHSDVMHFDVNVSWNEIRFTEAQAVLNVSGYNYTTTRTPYNNYTHFSADVTYNHSLFGGDLGYTWNITLLYKNLTWFENSTTYGGAINSFDINLYNCSASNESILFNITGFHEDNINLLAVDIDAKISVWTGDEDMAETFTFEWNDTQPENISNFSKSHYVCLSYNTSVYVNAYFLYNSPNGFTQRYYINKFEYQNNTNNEIHLYNRDSTTGISALKGTVRKKTDYNYFNNVIAKMLRYYPAEDVWRTVQMDKSGDFGLIHFNIEEVDKDYKFTFQDEDNHVLKNTESMKFKCDADTSICELTFLLDEWEGEEGVGGLIVSHTFDNATGIITVNWNDVTGVTDSIRVLVTKETMAGTTEICDTEVASSSGTTTCNASLYTGQLLVRLYSTASPESPFYFKWVERFSGKLKDTIPKVESAFWVFGITLTVTLFGGIISPVASIILFIGSLILLSAMGISGLLTITLLTIAVIISIAIGIKVKS